MGYQLKSREHYTNREVVASITPEGLPTLEWMTDGTLFFGRFDTRCLLLESPDLSRTGAPLLRANSLSPSCHIWDLKLYYADADFPGDLPVCIGSWKVDKSPRWAWRETVLQEAFKVLEDEQVLYFTTLDAQLQQEKANA